MAVISSKPQAAGSSAGAEDTGKKNIPVKVDLNDTSIPEGESQEIDKAADAYAFSAPPPHGIYQMGIFSRLRLDSGWVSLMIMTHLHFTF